MTAGNWDIHMEQGATLRIHFVYGTSTEATPTHVETPYDLTGCTAKMQFRKRYGEPVLLELSTANGEIELGGVDGTIDCYASDEQTDLIVEKRGKWDIELTYANGDVKRILMGNFYNSLAITRETP